MELVDLLRLGGNGVHQQLMRADIYTMQWPGQTDPAHFID